MQNAVRMPATQCYIAWAFESLICDGINCKEKASINLGPRWSYHPQASHPVPDCQRARTWLSVLAMSEMTRSGMTAREPNPE